VTKTASAIYDPASSVVRLTTIFEASAPGEAAARGRVRDRLRIVGPDDLSGLRGGAGLVVEELAGDYDLGPLEAGAERVVLVAGLDHPTGVGRRASGHHPGGPRRWDHRGRGEGALPCVVESARCRIS
jgi:hypothetical protein